MSPSIGGLYELSMDVFEDLMALSVGVEYFFSLPTAIQPATEKQDFSHYGRVHLGHGESLSFGHDQDQFGLLDHLLSHLTRPVPAQIEPFGFGKMSGVALHGVVDQRPETCRFDREPG